MGSLRSQRKKIPKHIWVFTMGGRVPLLRVNEIWKFEWVTQEKYWRIITYDVPVTFLGVKLQGKASRIALSVRTSLLAPHCRKSQ